jgi:hypothetical protein
LKIYKFKDKYVVYLPFEVIKQLGLKGEEEVDFFKFSEKAFLFAKKEDITNLLMGTKSSISAGPAPVSQAESRSVSITQDEIVVLKKLDTLRYSNRTPTNVSKILNEGEKKILQGLINKKVVLVYKDKKDSPYSIAKNVYDQFLMRKKELIKPAQQAKSSVQPVAKVQVVQKVAATPIKIIENENVNKLETDGFVVLPTETEASSLSLALEDSIRSGKVLGIRAFNKKFYIVLRAFFDKNSGKVIKELKEGPKSVSEMVKATGLNEDGIRAMLYLLSEQGDVSERRKDTFTLI